MGLKLAEQLKLDNTAVQKRRNWTLAQKEVGGWWRELFFVLLFLGIFLILREPQIGDDLKVVFSFIFNFRVKVPHHFKCSSSI